MQGGSLTGSRTVEEISNMQILPEPGSHLCDACTPSAKFAFIFLKAVLILPRRAVFEGWVYSLGFQLI